MEKKYIRRKNGTVVNIDTKDISSNCNQLVFACVGDWPFYVKITDQPFRFFVDRGMIVQFGDELPNVSETHKYEIEFDTSAAYTTKEATVMRIDFIEVKDKC